MRYSNEKITPVLLWNTGTSAVCTVCVDAALLNGITLNVDTKDDDDSSLDNDDDLSSDDEIEPTKPVLGVSPLKLFIVNCFLYVMLVF